jgi:hypothetical protein
MKRLYVFLTFAILLASSSTSTAQVKRNPLQAAMLKWWDVNLNEDAVTRFNGFLFGIAFDGADLWVSNLIRNELHKIRVTDGAVLATFSYANPEALAFDGRHLWVLSRIGGNVTKVRLSDGANVGQFFLPSSSEPRAIAFDGQSIWVVNSGLDSVTKMTLSGSMSAPFPVGDNPSAVL